jgi:transglutaminase-like putative cysteine protease
MKIRKFTPWLAVFSWAMASMSFAQPDWLKQAWREKDGVKPAEKAVALVLHNSAAVEISSDGSAKTHVRKAFAILKSAGEIYGVLSEAVAPFRKVKNLKGWLILPDGNTRLFNEKDKVEMSNGNYNDSYLLLARLPEAKAGAVAAFEYDIDENDYTSLFQRFLFQVQEPVKFAQFSVMLPEGWELNKVEWRTEGIVYEQTGSRHLWTARDLPYQPEEPLMPSWHFLSRRVAVTCYSPNGAKAVQFGDWPAVARWCAEMHQSPAALDETVAAQAKQLTQGLKTPAEKLQAIAAFVRDEIRYVAVEIDKGRFEPRPAATTLYNRYGDCKDKTTLMRAMLKAVEIPSLPVFANTSYAVNPALPTPFQFNHCIIGIPLTNITHVTTAAMAGAEGWLFFDPTHPTHQLGELPTPLQGNFVLVAAANDAKLQRLPYHAPADFRRRYRADAVLSAGGDFAAEVTITDFKNRAAESRYERSITPQEKQIEAWRAALSSTVLSPMISNYQTGAQGDSAWVSFQLKGSRYILEAGPLKLLKADFFHPSAPLELTAEQRHHPIWHGPPMQVETEIVWHLPPGRSAEVDMPKLNSTCGAANLSSEIVLHDHTLRYNSIMQQTGQLLPPEQYEAAKKFSRDLSAVKGLMVVIK